MAPDEKRISSEEAFHLVGETLAKISERIDRHAERLANNDETLKAMADLVGILRSAVIDLQVRAGLKPSGSEPTN